VLHLHLLAPDLYIINIFFFFIFFFFFFFIIPTTSEPNTDADRQTDRHARLLQLLLHAAVHVMEGRRGEGGRSFQHWEGGGTRPARVG
jgi:hypothetical protein